MKVLVDLTHETADGVEIRPGRSKRFRRAKGAGPWDMPRERPSAFGQEGPASRRMLIRGQAQGARRPLRQERGMGMAGALALQIASQSASVSGTSGLKSRSL